MPQQLQSDEHDRLEVAVETIQDENDVNAPQKPFPRALVVTTVNQAIGKGFDSLVTTPMTKQPSKLAGKSKYVPVIGGAL
jgi:hypothetical protein